MKLLHSHCLILLFLMNCVYGLSNHQHYGFRQISFRKPQLPFHKMKIKYMIDIDGTICSKTNSEYTSCVPDIEKIASFNQLYEQGHEVHYWTARGANSGINWEELTIEQLDSWDVKYHSLNMGKPHYDVWIDDKAINAHDFD